VPRWLALRSTQSDSPALGVSTEIIFGGAGERLIMRHDPGESPDPYVGGTLLAIRKVADLPGAAVDWVRFYSMRRAVLN
jgi:dihydrodipicolinate reductase